MPPSFHFYPLFSSVSVPCYDDSFLSPSIFAAKKKSDPDLFSYHEAMRHPDREKWIEAMEKEIKELEEHGVWISTTVICHKLKVSSMHLPECLRSNKGQMEQSRSTRPGSASGVI
jgi:hypothetical protein